MCDFCNTYRLICAQMRNFVPDTAVHRCPACGSIISIDLELIEVDGEYLLYDRQSSPEGKPIKPMSMKIDMDNVDISREWEMLMRGDWKKIVKQEPVAVVPVVKKEPLTPEEFHQQMRNIRDKWYDNYDDEEACHEAMDDLMCELLDDLGYGDGVSVFTSTPKYYA